MLYTLHIYLKFFCFILQFANKSAKSHIIFHHFSSGGTKMIDNIYLQGSYIKNLNIWNLDLKVYVTGLISCRPSHDYITVTDDAEIERTQMVINW